MSHNTMRFSSLLSTVFIFLVFLMILDAVAVIQHQPLSDKTGSVCDLSGIYKMRQNVLTSPHYPASYPSGVCWDYVVRSPYRCPTKFHVQFLNFSVTPSTNCVRDFLVIGQPEDDNRINLLCGEISGIKIYHTRDGILRLRFQSANEADRDYVHGSPNRKSFKLLVTRLACECNDVEDNENVQDDIPIPLDLQPPHLTRLVSFRNLSSRAESEDSYKKSLNAPFQESGHFQQGRPEQNQQLTAGSGEVPDLCCATSFRQPRFYLSSPGFPRTTITHLLPIARRDCQFFLEKAAPSICRLRIIFKFFNFGQIGSFHDDARIPSPSKKDTVQDICYEDYIEIDGVRICGCRTGYIFTAPWGLGRKVLRLRMGHSGIASSGFLLDIIQEECIEETQLEFRLSQYTFEASPEYQLQQLPQVPQLSQFSQLPQLPQVPLVPQLPQLTQLLPSQSSSFSPQFVHTHSQSYGSSAESTFIRLSPNNYNPQPIQPFSQHFIYPGAISTPELFNSRQTTNFGDHHFDGGNQLNLLKQPDLGLPQRRGYMFWKQNHCHFDINDIWRLSDDYLWQTKPICRAPQTVW